MSSDTSIFFSKFKEDNFVLLEECGLRDSGPKSRLHKWSSVWPQQILCIVDDTKHNDCISFVNGAFVQEPVENNCIHYGSIREAEPLGEIGERSIIGICLYTIRRLVKQSV